MKVKLIITEEMHFRQRVVKYGRYQIVVEFSLDNSLNVIQLDSAADHMTGPGSALPVDSRIILFFLRL